MKKIKRSIHSEGFALSDGATKLPLSFGDTKYKYITYYSILNPYKNPSSKHDNSYCGQKGHWWFS